MTKMDPVVRKETGYIAAWVLALSPVMELVFALLRRWDFSVLTGNLAGAAMAVGNYLLLGRAVVRAVALGQPDKAALQIRSSRTVRLLGVAALCALCVGVLKTNVYATLIPLLFPRIGLAFRPLIDRKRGAESSGPEGGDLLE